MFKYTVTVGNWELLLIALQVRSWGSAVKNIIIVNRVWKVGAMHVLGNSTGPPASTEQSIPT